MNTQRIIGIAGIVLVIGAVYYFTIGIGQKEVGNMMTYDETAPESTSMGDGHTTHDEQPTQGVTEKAFLEHMIPHHQEAVTASQAILEKSSNQAVKELATAIIAAQEKEITDMKTWYEAWYNTPYQDAPYTPMMRDISDLSDNDADRAYLEDMIAHHTAALTQAQSVAPNATHVETITLARAIAETQSSEIITMRTILKQI